MAEDERTDVNDQPVVDPTSEQEEAPTSEQPAVDQGATAPIDESPKETSQPQRSDDVAEKAKRLAQAGNNGIAIKAAPAANTANGSHQQTNDQGTDTNGTIENGAIADVEGDRRIIREIEFHQHHHKRKVPDSNANKRLTHETLESLGDETLQTYLDALKAEEAARGLRPATISSKREIRQRRDNLGIDTQDEYITDKEIDNMTETEAAEALSAIVRMEIESLQVSSSTGTQPPSKPAERREDTVEQKTVNPVPENHYSSEPPAAATQPATTTVVSDKVLKHPGLFHVTERDWEEALDEFEDGRLQGKEHEKILKGEGKNPGLIMLLEQYGEQQKRLKQALGQILPADKKVPVDPEALVKLVKKQIEAAKPADADLKRLVREELGLKDGETLDSLLQAIRGEIPDVETNIRTSLEEGGLIRKKLDGEKEVVGQAIQSIADRKIAPRWLVIVLPITLMVTTIMFGIAIKRNQSAIRAIDGPRPAPTAVETDSTDNTAAQQPVVESTESSALSDLDRQLRELEEKAGQNQ